MKTVRLFISAIVPGDGASQYFAPFRRDAEEGAPDRRDVAAEERNGHEQPVAFTVRQDISTCLSSNSAATRDSTQHPHATCCNPRTYDCSKIFASNGLSRAFERTHSRVELLKNYEVLFVELSTFPESIARILETKLSNKRLLRQELCARDSRETRPTHFDRSSAEGSTTTDVQSEQHREKERKRGEESHEYGATVEEREREREREREAEAGERASASEVETRGSCLAPGVPLFPQTVAPNATHLSRPTYRAILKPACIPGAGFSLLFPSYPRSCTAFFFPSSCGRCNSLRPTTYGTV
ncbi:hypothetical protein G5I_10094 [Acromyrmex echinatior]|uniref:Uncharacterized protein n=1 Tax=Acromyrmex echinatior TaxID=103372 RepID=F4WW60_ACREC|nr:hypothetical protein G5I_10094 [Acromyrmex echinatior]